MAYLNLNPSPLQDWDEVIGSLGLWNPEAMIILSDMLGVELGEVEYWVEDRICPPWVLPALRNEKKLQKISFLLERES